MPETEPCCTQTFQNAAPLNPSKCPPNLGKFAETFCKMRKLSEIVFLASWTSSTFFLIIFCGPLKRRVRCRPRLRTALSSFQFCILGVSRLVAHCHTTKSFEPTISLPNSHGPLAQPSNGRTTLQAISARTPLLNTPLFFIAVFLLTVGSFLLTGEFFAYN